MPGIRPCIIVLLNDDITPMEFVVHVLQEYLDFSYDDALKLMLRVHHGGKAICRTCERHKAETRVAAMMALAH